MTTDTTGNDHPAREPIAIVGIGCRFPGDAESPDELWSNLIGGVDAIREIPADRWAANRFFDSRAGVPGKSSTRRGGFLGQIDQFEPECFGIAPREAPYIDPQQRLLLEVAWEAMEDGGHASQQLAGTNTGVFIGISTSDYADIQSTIHDMRSVDAHTATGGAFSIAANRISYCFDFKGPSLSVDTACSSSLVAVHLACRSLWQRESSLALAGGVNLIITPSTYVAFSAATMLSRQGLCRAFDADADGFVRGEGAGMVLLKPLSKAVADGDRIYALILGSAINQDGRTPGITMPDQGQQEMLLGEVCRQAGVEPCDIQYVEAHGTGTPVGDPIEANAIGKALATGRTAENACVIGSVKTSIGHLEAGAGIAGLIKTALAIHHRKIPPNLHFKRPNPHIDFDELRLRVPTVVESWPRETAPLLAGVNSFGFGGANAHVILRDHPSPRPTTGDANPDAAAMLLPITARSPEALEQIVRAYRDEVASGDRDLADVCYAASVRRNRYDHGLSVVVRDRAELRDRLDGFLAGERRPGMFAGKRGARPPSILFAFCGQGPQWWAMGRQLIASEPVFRESIRACDALISEHADWSLWNELTADEAASRMQRTAIAQPALFAIQVALAELWRSWGVTPSAVIGHSVGEIAAAHVAGILPLSEAVRVVFHRGRCMDLVSSRGKMLAAALSVVEAEEVIGGRTGSVSVAAANSPRSVTLSGNPEVLETIAETLVERNVWHRFLKVEYAFHSPLMDAVREDLLASLGELQLHGARIPILSTVTGAEIDGARLTGEYWWRGLRHRVFFAEAMDEAIRRGIETFVEIGPHPVLSGYMAECLHARQRKADLLPSLRREEDERPVILGSLGALHILGHPVNWSALWPEARRPVRLPAYPWRRERYWHEVPEIADPRLNPEAHPLLVRDLRAANPTWQTPLDTRVLAYLVDHRVERHTVFPGAGFVEMAAAASRRITGQDAAQVEEVQFLRALFLSDGGMDTAVQIRIDQEDGSFDIQSGVPGSGGWTVHCKGSVTTDRIPTPAIDEGLEPIRARLTETLDAATCYARYAEIGLHYGPAFQGVREIVRRDGEALGDVRLPDGLEALGYHFHPALLDACFQVLFGAVPQATLTERRSLFLPVYIRRVTFCAPPGPQVFCHARIRQLGANILEGDLDLLDGAGRLAARIEGLRCQALDRSRTSEADDPMNWIYEVRWENKVHPESLAATRTADFIPSVRDLAVSAREAATDLGTRLGLAERAAAVDADMNRIAHAFIVRFLRGAGVGLELGDLLREDDLIDRLHPAMHHQRLLHRFLIHLRERGRLHEVAAGEWRVIDEPPFEDPEALWRDAWGRYPGYSMDLNLLGRCGRRIGEVIAGEVNPLQILFPDGPTTTLATFYQSAPIFMIGNRMVQSALRRIQEALPEGRILRVLEVGAGTGGLTAELLPMLAPHRASYAFTDVSPLFLAKAEQRFGAYPFVRFGSFDLDRDPEEQEFALHSFDLIVASDVLHASADIRKSVERLRRMLSPEGLLLLLEGERRNPWVDVVFGLTEGWWHFTDVDLRPDHPLLDRVQWQSVLKNAGFESVEALPYDPSEPTSPQIVVLARNSRDVPGRDAPLPPTETAAASIVDPPAAAVVGGRPPVWLLFADRGVVASGLRDLLEARGDRCVTVVAGTEFAALGNGLVSVAPRRPEEMDRLLGTLDPAHDTIEGMIHLWSLDAPNPDGDSAEPLLDGEALGCHSVLHLLQSLERTGRLAGGPRLVLVTRGAQPTDEGRGPTSISQSPLLGLGRVLLNEHPDLRTKLIDLDRVGLDDEIQWLFNELFTDDPEEEVALRRESRLVPRAGRFRGERVSAASLGIDREGGSGFRLMASTTGAMDSLAWRETPRRSPGAGEVEIRVAAAGLNFRDVLKALALYPAEADDYLLLGDECAGRVTAVGPGVTGFSLGDEVVAMAPAAFASTVIAPATAVLAKPGNLTFEEAATIPVTFLTAYYALHEIARLREGESVLIHSGAGGVGMAAIQIAKCAGAKVLATAGSPEKREVLKLMGVDHVMDSRTLSFADEVLAFTGGRGVDIVLNSLAGRAIQKGLSCMAPFGRFLELGKRDIYQNSRIGLWAFRKNISLQAIDLGRVAKEDPALLRRMFESLMERFAKADYHALPHTIFEASRAVDAFRHVAQGRHIGKLVLSLDDPDLLVERVLDGEIAFRSDASYLITGGFGGFGLVIARWVAEHGGRNLVLTGRSGAASEEARAAIADLERSGVRVLALKSDVTDASQLHATMEEVRRTMPPLRGVFHTAMVIDDGILQHLNGERFARVLAPKVSGTWNLHRATLDDPLDHFVLFSSVGTWVGTPGQANYVAANAFLDAFGHHRRFLGLPVLTVDWGRLDAVGYVSRHAQVSEILTRRGFIGFSPEQAMVGLDTMLRCRHAQMGYFRLDWSASAQVLTKMRVARRVAAMFGELDANRGVEEEGERVRSALRQAKPTERGEILREYIRGEVARVLGASAAKLDPDRPLNQMGFDSLMAVELKNHVDTDLALSLPTGALMEAPTINTLAAAVLDLFEGRTPAARTPSPSQEVPVSR